MSQENPLDPGDTIMACPPPPLTLVVGEALNHPPAPAARLGELETAGDGAAFVYRASPRPIVLASLASLPLDVARTIQLSLGGAPRPDRDRAGRRAAAEADRRGC